jgi:polyhydroxyalkanoate synthesis regulator phasin
MQDAWRAYLEMALGLTEAPRKRAQKVVGDLANRGGATAAQVQGLVEDLFSAGMANREALTNIVRFEVDRALGMVGLATAEEVGELTGRVRELEKQLRDAQARVSAAEAVADEGAGEPGTGGTRIDQPAPVPGKAAKKTVAKKTVAKKAVKRATPNAMPAAALTPPVKKAAPRAAPPAQKATDVPAHKATDAPARETQKRAGAPVKKTAGQPAKKAPAKKAPPRKNAGDTTP